MNDREIKLPVAGWAEIYARIQNYLENGGLFNPELMEHEKVRDLLMDVRDLIGGGAAAADYWTRRSHARPRSSAAHGSEASNYSGEALADSVAARSGVGGETAKLRTALKNLIHAFGTVGLAGGEWEFRRSAIKSAKEALEPLTRCKNCGEPSVTCDPEGVPLCAVCATPR